MLDFDFRFARIPKQRCQKLGEKVYFFPRISHLILCPGPFLELSPSACVLCLYGGRKWKEKKNIFFTYYLDKKIEKKWKKFLFFT